NYGGLLEISWIILLALTSLVFINWIRISIKRIMFTPQDWQEYLKNEKEQIEISKKETEEYFKKRSLQKENCYYISGHPYIDDSQKIALEFSDTAVIIKNIHSLEPIGEIPYKTIRKTSIEDATTVEKR